MSSHPPPAFRRLFRRLLSRTPEGRPWLPERLSTEDAVQRRLAELLSSGQSETDDPDPHAPAPLQLGRYRIRSLIARGAMGDVYLAEDVRLRRNVAVKLLPERLTGQIERVKRFQREAWAASALSHPNILTVHEFGEHDGQRFLVTEFVDGETLRDVLRAGGVPLREGVEIASQVAGALAAAHEAGVIHRDIKPENIMRRRDGLIKVLDFGLAKLAEAPERPEDTGPEPSVFATQDGALLGTVHYMSPEQARGEAVDARSDLFSFGVVLYELLANRRPFEGPSASHVLVAIQDQEPQPLAALRSDIPPELDRIVRRLLAKQPAGRYASGQEVQADLDRLARTWPGGTEGGRAPLPASGRRPVRPTSPLRTASASRTGGGHRRGWQLAGLLAVLALAAAGGYRGWVRPGVAPPVDARPQLEMTRITSTGDALFATIAPQGDHLAYVVRDDTGLGLRMRDLKTREDWSILDPGRVAYWSIAFSADGASLYFVQEDHDHQVGGALYNVPTAGGTPRHVLSNVAQVAAVPGDGRLLLRRWEGDPVVSVVSSIDAEGREERILSTGTTNRTPLTFACSPDGEKLALATFTSDGGAGFWDLTEIPLSGGPGRPMIAGATQDIDWLAWLPDGRGLILSRRDPVSLQHQLWHFREADGTLRRITHDLNNYEVLSVTADGETLVAAQRSRPARLWISPLADPARAHPLASGTGAYGELAAAPDGSIVYTLENDLWVLPPGGSPPRRLTQDAGSNLMPEVSPDGGRVAFLSNRSGGSMRLWSMNADGHDPRQLTDHEGSALQFAPDGSWVIYQRSLPEGPAIWRVPVAGGPPEELMEGASHPAISPDGRWLAYEYFDHTVRRHRIAVGPLAGGPPVRVFDDTVGYGSIRWMPDSRHVVYAPDAKHGTVLVRSVDGGPPTEFHTASQETILSFTLSSDGRQIAYASGELVSDIVLLRNFL